MAVDVPKEFVAGKFVGQKTSRLFSCIALDQMHEQLNAVLKGDGGITGLTEHAAQLMKHMVIGPEYSRLIQEFEKRQTDFITMNSTICSRNPTEVMLMP